MKLNKELQKIWDSIPYARVECPYDETLFCAIQECNTCPMRRKYYQKTVRDETK